MLCMFSINDPKVPKSTFPMQAPVCTTPSYTASTSIPSRTEAGNRRDVCLCAYMGFGMQKGRATKVGEWQEIWVAVGPAFHFDRNDLNRRAWGAGVALPIPTVRRANRGFGIGCVSCSYWTVAKQRSTPRLLIPKHSMDIPFGMEHSGKPFFCLVANNVGIFVKVDGTVGPCGIPVGVGTQQHSYGTTGTLIRDLGRCIGHSSQDGTIV